MFQFDFHILSQHASAVEVDEATVGLMGKSFINSRHVISYDNQFLPSAENA
jgi:hypothetical protein